MLNNGAVILMMFCLLQADSLVDAGAQSNAISFEILPNNGTVPLNTVVTILCNPNGQKGTFRVFRGSDIIFAYDVTQHPSFANGDLWSNKTKHQHSWQSPTAKQTAFGAVFKASWADEGNYRCENMHMVTVLKSNSRRLVISVPAGQPKLRVGAGIGTTDWMFKSGDTVTVNCTANVGRPAGHVLLSTTLQNVTHQVRRVWISTNQHSTFESVQASVLLTPGHRNQSFCCTVEDGAIHTAAKNSTDSSSNRVCTPPLTIYTPVTGTHLSPVKNTYLLGEVIHCQAQGWPEPDYAWIKSLGNGDLTVRGADLIVNTSSTTIWPITTNIIDFEYTCQASNTVKNITYVHSKTEYFHVRRERVTPKPTPAPTMIPRSTGGYDVNGAVGGKEHRSNWVAKHIRALKIAGIILGGVLCMLIICIIGVHCSATGTKETTYHKLETERGR